MFIQRCRIFLFFKLKIPAHNFSSRNYSVCVNNVLYNIRNKKENQSYLIHKNYKNLRFYSDKNIDSCTLNKCFDYLTKSYQSYEVSKNKNDLTKTLNINEVVTLLKERSKILSDIKNLESLVDQDKDIKELAIEEEINYKNNLETVECRLLEKITENVGTDNCRDIIFEINAGVGGQESMLFAKDLLQMYLNHFDYLNYNYEIIETNETEINGIKKVLISVSGDKAMEILRHESGVHRVQRVPVTEKTGRMHTSVVSIAVLPQPSEIDIVINKKELKIETMRSSGAGGQSVNTTDSAVRITHLPTGTIVECQTQRSQIQNMKTAMLKLRLKMYQNQMEKSISQAAKSRKQQMGLKNRNERIRTYNYNQNRVTDHRITENGTVNNLKAFLEGGEALKKFQDKLQQNYQKSVLINIVNSVSNR